MIIRILGTSCGIYLILLVLLSRGLPVLIFIKMIPLLIIVLLGMALIYAGISKDS